MSKVWLVMALLGVSVCMAGCVTLPSSQPNLDRSTWKEFDVTIGKETLLFKCPGSKRSRPAYGRHVTESELRDGRVTVAFMMPFDLRKSSSFPGFCIDVWVIPRAKSKLHALGIEGAFREKLELPNRTVEKKLVDIGGRKWLATLIGKPTSKGLSPTPLGSNYKTIVGKNEVRLMFGYGDVDPIPRTKDWYDTRLAIEKDVIKSIRIRQPGARKN